MHGCISFQYISVNSEYLKRITLKCAPCPHYRLTQSSLQDSILKFAFNVIGHLEGFSWLRTRVTEANLQSNLLLSLADWGSVLAGFLKLEAEVLDSKAQSHGETLSFQHLELLVFSWQTADSCSPAGELWLFLWLFLYNQHAALF